MITGRDEGRGAAVLAAIEAAGGRAAFVAGDVRESAFCDRVVAETVDQLGGLDVLVNSAGVFWPGATMDIAEEEWLETMAINVDAVFYMSRAGVRAMQAGGGGAIVNFGSDYSLIANAGFVAYCASKGAVVQMTRTMALDHADDGIRVNALCPGAVPTPMMLAALEGRGYGIEEGIERIVKATPIQRLATAEEVARATLFLASPGQGYITGVALPLDGGNTAR